MARGRESNYRSSTGKRSSSRDRDRSPVRGNKFNKYAKFDMTSDPETISSRIFVGGIITPDITQDALEEHFSRWGNVLGVSMSKHFAFVQYEKDGEAQACVASGYTTTVAGIKLKVKQAKIESMGKPPIPPPSSLSSFNPGADAGDSWGSSRNAYGSSRNPPPPREDYYDPYYRGSTKPRQEPETVRYGDYYHDDYYERQRGGRGRGGSGIGGRGSEGSSYYGNEPDPRSPPHHSASRSFGSSSSYPQPAEPLDPLDPMRPNDVEIVVPNKQQRKYAESIEGQLKRMNLLVDLLFPPPDITPARVVSDLTARGCLYAIFATSENEKHNSLTLNILHGEAQEHRNMPVDDALRLVQRDFEDYVKKARLRNMRSVVPRDIRNLLLDLLEMRPLSMGDLDKLIKYLRERQNTLVDDQIEQKRETAGTHPSVMAGDMAVTYPGYNYLATTVPGAVTGTNQTSVAAGHPGMLPTAGAPHGVTNMTIVSSSNAAAAAAAIAAYPASAYSGLTASGVIGAYGMPSHVAQAPAAQGQASHQVMSAPHQAPVNPAGTQKQSELQERIMNLMKSQGGIPTSGMAVPGGVPPPTGVPPPSVVPGQRMMQPPPQQQQPMWMTQQPPRPNENDAKVSPAQSGQQTYSPWGQ